MDAATDAGNTDGQTMADAPVFDQCTPLATSCSGNSVLGCRPDGLWEDAAAACATDACSAGACSGETTDGPSCVGAGVGQADCGSTGEDCCTSIEVPGGNYHWRGLDGGVSPYLETVSGFRLDRYLATVGRFRKFVAAWNAGWRPPAGAGKHDRANGGLGLLEIGPPDAGATYESGWLPANDQQVSPTDANLATCAPFSSWTSSPASTDVLPINCVNWYEALAFCIWDGGFVPTITEWGYAAAGGDEQRPFPWGSTNPGTSSQYAIYDCLYPDGGAQCAGVENIAPVGSAALGAGRFGQLDLVGEVSEWSLDSLILSPLPAACVDCVYGGETTVQLFRSYGYKATVAELSAWTGDYFPPTTRDGSLGFRCARDP
jgi:sulfatase modifying factor 1